MHSGTLHEHRSARHVLDGFSYELEADRYPRLGDEFFTGLRQKYPRAFQRCIWHDVAQSSVKSVTSAEDSKSVWTLWDCNGDDDRAAVKEAGGVLIPRSDLSVHERLRRNCDSFSAVKTACADLLLTLRNFRTALLAENKSISCQRGTANDFSASHGGGAITHDGCLAGTTAASNSSVLNAASQNSSHETVSSRGDTLHHGNETVGVSSFQSAELQQETDEVAAGIDAALGGCNTDYDAPQIALDVDKAVSSTPLQDAAENQLPSTDELNSSCCDPSLTMELIQTDTDQGLVSSA